MDFLLCPCDSEFHLNMSLDVVVPSFEATPSVRKQGQEGEGFVRTTCLLGEEAPPQVRVMSGNGAGGSSNYCFALEFCVINEMG